MSEYQYRVDNSWGKWGDWRDIDLPFVFEADYEDQVVELRLKPAFEPGYYQWVGADPQHHESAVWCDHEPDSDLWAPVDVTPREID